MNNSELLLQKVVNREKNLINNILELISVTTNIKYDITNPSRIYYYNNGKYQLTEFNDELIQKLLGIIKNIISEYIFNKKSFDQLSEKIFFGFILNILKEINLTTSKLYYHNRNINSFRSQLKESLKTNKINFTEKLDNNDHLIGFNNGVFDLNLKEFRPLTQQDFITMSTNYEYQNIQENDIRIKEINEFFEKIFLDEDIRNLFLRYVSSFLDGNFNDQPYVILTSKYSSGLSSCIELIRKTFGDYFSHWNNPYHSSSYKDPGCNDGLIYHRNKRCLLAIIPESSSVQIDILKKFVNTKNYLGHELCGYDFNYTPKYKVITVCSDRVPNIISKSHSSFNKLIIIPFESTFTLNPKKSKEFKEDRYINEKFASWSPCFMWLLLNRYFPQYKNEGLVLPNKIKDLVLVHRSQIYIDNFITDNYIINKYNYREPLESIWSHFKNYYNLPDNTYYQMFINHLTRQLKLKIYDGIVFGISKK